MSLIGTKKFRNNVIIFKATQKCLIFMHILTKEGVKLIALNYSTHWERVVAFFSTILGFRREKQHLVKLPCNILHTIQNDKNYRESRLQLIIRISIGLS